MYFLRLFNQLALDYLKPTPFLKITFNNLPAVQYTVPFRCWPVDIFFHMNNAAFFRVAEMARWRVIYSSNLLNFMLKYGALFMVVEQEAQYFDMIHPMDRYIVETKLTEQSGKWIMFHHIFKQLPELVPEGQKQRTYATINAKYVLKYKNGKTVRLNEISSISPFFQAFILPDINKPINE